MDKVNPETVAVIAMTQAFTGGVSLPRGQKGFPPGECEVCGKPNVKLGREKGLYRCWKHRDVILKDSEENPGLSGPSANTVVEGE